MKKKYLVEVAKWIFAYVVGFLTLIYFGSCYNTKKAEKQTRKALIEYPAVVAKIARDAFPCIITKSDTLISYTDTTIVVNCPTGNDFEGGDISSSGEVIKHDTLNVHDTVQHFRKVAIKIPLKIIDITQHIADSAQNKVLQAGIDNLNMTIAKMQHTIESDTETIKSKNKMLLYLWLALALGVVGIILKLIIKSK